MNYEKLAEYYEENRQRILMKNRLYRLKNKEKIKRMQKKYRRKVKNKLIRVRNRQKMGHDYMFVGYK